MILYIQSFLSSRVRCFYKIYTSRIITSQYSIGFYQTSTWISHRYPMFTPTWTPAHLPPVFKNKNRSLWTCSKSLMPYSIQFTNNYKFLLRPLPGPAFLLLSLAPTSRPFWFCTWWEMVRNASCCCWLRCLLTILLQTIEKHKRKINSTPTTRAILYPNVLICFKGLREERWSATVSRKSDPEITSRCLLKPFSISGGIWVTATGRNRVFIPYNSTIELPFVQASFY